MDTIATSTKLEEQVYNNYRASLRRANKGSGDRNSRAAQRRQSARKLTVERYGVSFAEVKRIVAKFDGLNGVTHDHTPQYSRQLLLIEARADFEQNPVPCSCGETDTVRPRFNPFEVEIHGNWVIGITCDACDLLSELDI